MNESICVDGVRLVWLNGSFEMILGSGVSSM